MNTHKVLVMKTWIITFDLGNEEKTFEKIGDNVDDLILELKKQFPKYRAIIFHVKN